MVITIAALGLSGYAQGTTTQAPRVITGPDLGFRVDGWSLSQPYGTLVIRVNGQWVEASLGKKGPVPLTSR